MGQRAYCNMWHPDGDNEADRWCENYHRPVTPLDREGRAQMRAAASPSTSRAGPTSPDHYTELRRLED